MPPGSPEEKKEKKRKWVMSEKYIRDPRSTPGDGFPEIS
jgi:hypothetical protein